MTSPGTAREMFAAGYRSVDPALPADWFDVAKLIDLGNTVLVPGPPRGLSGDVPYGPRGD
jgi:hypothetical protein